MPPAKNEAPALTHTVELQGETLGAIAAWYTGDAANWEKLANANPKIHPKALQIGDEVRIPGRMVVRRAKLTKQSLAAMSAKKSRIAVARTEEKGAEEKSTGEKDGLRDEMRDTSEKRKPVQAVSAAPSVPTVAEPASGDLQSEILRDRLEDALLEKKSNEPKK